MGSHVMRAGLGQPAQKPVAIPAMLGEKFEGNRARACSRLVLTLPEDMRPKWQILTKRLGRMCWRNRPMNSVGDNETVSLPPNQRNSGAAASTGAMVCSFPQLLR